MQERQNEKEIEKFQEYETRPSTSKDNYDWWSQQYQVNAIIAY